MSENSKGSRELQEKMLVVANGVTQALILTVEKLIRGGMTDGLSKDAAALAGLVGCMSVIRTELLNEEALIKEARKASTVRYAYETIVGRPKS